MNGKRRGWVYVIQTVVFLILSFFIISLPFFNGLSKQFAAATSAFGGIGGIVPYSVSLAIIYLISCVVGDFFARQAFQWTSQRAIIVLLILIVVPLLPFVLLVGLGILLSK